MIFCTPAYACTARASFVRHRRPTWSRSPASTPVEHRSRDLRSLALPIRSSGRPQLSSDVVLIMTTSSTMTVQPAGLESGIEMTDRSPLLLELEAMATAVILTEICAPRECVETS